ncbi:ribosome maturation factor RimP [Limnobacter humi]|uniref:Ribosome maturation factor RimP n=1 Tax=Limnobacter humi TaxID=1778671 RepID=A0ABT1WFU3_9BURK|nr:ribosome maturation factor RimP [Limnobacter humi]MCQ8896386.1 ribosome maturation factor RimP [Limnobacter humi]
MGVLNPEEFVGNTWSGVWSEAWVDQAEAVIVSLGLEIADIEREGNGLLRIMIDSENGISVEDCEKVSHQLSHLFTVENVNYERLEISSPGVDRVLRRVRDFNRFLGEEVSLKFKRAIDNQKQFKGLLQKGDKTAWGLLVTPEGKKAQPYLLDFEIADLAGARLVPHLKF